ncbi:FKBP12-interacting protein of 37 kDa-like isoform X2 [Lycium barbarum]|uniref:FKBP12-interacting protein of 37 kDa-like isoform X2 n=1 Tax=Lycium barbarum TaxID=112863 RepID=UPI00293EC9A9|nr:FKBP12-interacting protein of 37 kDa-like isoform X2 [Lycium barbarum]
MFWSAVRDLRVQLKPLSMQNLVDEKDKKVKELQDDIAAVIFTPQSKMGKMLMAKCRTLQEEIEEIGTRLMKKSQNADLKSEFEGYCYLLKKKKKKKVNLKVNFLSSCFRKYLSFPFDWARISCLLLVLLGSTGWFGPTGILDMIHVVIILVRIF